MDFEAACRLDFEGPLRYCDLVEGDVLLSSLLGILVVVNKMIVDDVSMSLTYLILENISLMNRTPTGGLITSNPVSEMNIGPFWEVIRVNQCGV